MMISLNSTDIHKVKNKKCFIVENPRDCDNFEWLVGEEVIIGDDIYLVSGVEFKNHAPPWLKGERISIMVT